MASTQQFQPVVNQVSREVIGESLPNLTIQAALQDWLESTRRMNAPTTYERYKGMVDSFLKVLGPAASQSLRDINPAHIERFRNHRLDEDVAPKTVGVDVKILSIGFRRAERFGYIDKNPVSAVQLPRITSSESEIFALAEMCIEDGIKASIGNKPQCKMDPERLNAIIQAAIQDRKRLEGIIPITILEGEF